MGGGLGVRIFLSTQALAVAASANYKLGVRGRQLVPLGSNILSMYGPAAWGKEAGEGVELELEVQG